MLLLTVWCEWQPLVVFTVVWRWSDHTLCFNILTLFPSVIVASEAVGTMISPKHHVVSLQPVTSSIWTGIYLSLSSVSFGSTCLEAASFGWNWESEPFEIEVIGWNVWFKGHFVLQELTHWFSPKEFYLPLKDFSQVSWDKNGIIT